jgi:hypothetical protein
LEDVERERKRKKEKERERQEKKNCPTTTEHVFCGGFRDILTMFEKVKEREREILTTITSKCVCYTMHPVLTRALVFLLFQSLSLGRIKRFSHGQVIL